MPALIKPFLARVFGIQRSIDLLIVGPTAITKPSVAISIDLAELSVGAIDSFIAIELKVRRLGP